MKNLKNANTIIKQKIIHDTRTRMLKNEQKNILEIFQNLKNIFM